MNEVREWTAVICLAAIVAAVVQGMVPNGSMERMAKFVIGAFILCALIVPIAKLTPRLGTELSQNSRAAQPDTRLSSAVNRQYESAAQESVSNLVAAELGRIGMKCKNVQVMMDTNQSGSISITKVIVTLDSKNAADRQKAADALNKALGLKVEVVSNGG